jgi:hypothetical protein
MLRSLSLNRVGPADTLHLDFDPRLNVLTGDNGLGKTFVLDIAWWVLTGSWPTSPRSDVPGGYHFSAQEVWDGKPLDAPKKVSEGMIVDWRDWQQNKDSTTFDFLCDLLAVLSPSDDERLRPGSAARPVSLSDARKIPILQLPYGEVPITLVSAGMRRILALAYMIVWSWSRYLEAPEIFEIEASPHMIFLIDEVEAHLHPRWQRVIVPAILKAVERVQADMEVQVLMTTHSPMVLASLEPIFEEEKDQLFNFRVDQGVVKVDRLDREKQGDATGWLESAVFGLGEARSKPAEEAIERANEFLRAAGGTPSDAIVV